MCITDRAYTPFSASVDDGKKHAVFYLKWSMDQRVTMCLKANRDEGYSLTRSTATASVASSSFYLTLLIYMFSCPYFVGEGVRIGEEDP